MDKGDLCIQLCISMSHKPASLCSNYDSFSVTISTHSFLSKTFIQAVKASIISNAETAPGVVGEKKKKEKKRGE